MRARLKAGPMRDSRWLAGSITTPRHDPPSGGAGELFNSLGHRLPIMDGPQSLHSVDADRLLSNQNS